MPNMTISPPTERGASASVSMSMARYIAGKSVAVSAAPGDVQGANLVVPLFGRGAHPAHRADRYPPAPLPGSAVAQAAIWAREVKPSLVRMFSTWPSAVRCEMTSRAVGGHEKMPGDGHEAARWRT